VSLILTGLSVVHRRGCDEMIVGSSEARTEDGITDSLSSMSPTSNKMFPDCKSRRQLSSATDCLPV